MRIPVGYLGGSELYSGSYAEFCQPCTERLWRACDDWDEARHSNGGLAAEHASLRSLLVESVTEEFDVDQRTRS